MIPDLWFTTPWGIFGADYCSAIALWLCLVTLRAVVAPGRGA